MIGTIAAGAALSRAKGFFRSIPREVWYALAVALLAFLAWRYVDGKIDDAYDRGHKEGVIAEATRIEAKAKQLKEQGDAIAAKIRKVTDEKIVSSDAVARTIVLRGPGKAAYSCPSQPAASGHHEGHGAIDAGVDFLPDPERSQLAVVPFIELVERARTCDANRLEVRAWREDHAKRSQLK